MAAGMLAPVLVLSTGRCGSTMVSDILSRHPGILSVSEFFSFVGPRAFVGRRLSGERIWCLYSRPGRPIRRLRHFGIPSELLYPLDDSAARFSLDDLPPILAITLPHLTAEYHDLYDECGRVVRAQPRQAPAEHHRRFFEWLAGRFRRRVWVERSGGSLLWGSRLLGAFPDARVIHVYRDGRDTALSMSRHPPFRVMLAIRNQLKPLGLDPMGWVGSASGRVVALLDELAGMLVRPERLRLDRVSLADFAWFWNQMIEMGDDLFGHFPSHRLLNVAFRGCAGVARIRDTPDRPVHLPGARGRCLAANRVVDSTEDHLQVPAPWGRRAGRRYRSVPSGPRAPRLPRPCVLGMSSTSSHPIRRHRKVV